MLLSTFTENQVQFRCHCSIVAKATFIKTEKDIFQKQPEIGPRSVIGGELIIRIAVGLQMSRSVCSGTGASRPVSVCSCFSTPGSSCCSATF